jgi:hypothetical protein
MMAMNQNERCKAAVSILRNELSPDSAKIIRFSIEQAHCPEILLRQAGFGIAIRNLLAKHGILWEDVAVFATWHAILRESVKAFHGGLPAVSE